MGKLRILPVNNLPSINEPFMLRDGLTLEEVYLKEAEIKKAEMSRDLFVKEKDADELAKEKEEDDKAVVASVVAKMDKMEKAKNLDNDTGIDIDRLFYS